MIPSVRLLCKKKKQDDRLYPAHVKQLDTHVARLRKVAETARDLIVKPVNGLIHDLAERKSLSKQLMFPLPIT